MDIRLFFDKVKLALQKRSGVTQTKKDYDWWKAKGYDNEPEVRFNGRLTKKNSSAYYSKTNNQLAIKAICGQNCSSVL